MTINAMRDGHQMKVLSDELGEFCKKHSVNVFEMLAMTAGLVACTADAEEDEMLVDLFTVTLKGWRMLQEKRK